MPPHPLPLTRRWVEDYRNHLAGELRGACPDLQALVREWDGYSNIPLEAWGAYDRAMVEWQRLRRGLLIRTKP